MVGQIFCNIDGLAGLCIDRKNDLSDVLRALTPGGIKALGLNVMLGPTGERHLAVAGLVSEDLPLVVGIAALRNQGAFLEPLCLARVELLRALDVRIYQL